jgi:hypothetical protein
MQIQKITVPTPRLVNITFLVFVMIMMTPFFTYVASAKTDCRTEWENWFFQQIDPAIQKQCGKKFLYYTRIEIKRFNDYFNKHNKYVTNSN